jgi:TMEM175 potassium channel family protein
LSDKRARLGAHTSDRTGRLEAFSDGVFAIAITLLVLELSIGEHGPALERVLVEWSSYLSYLVSFLTIGTAWLIHVGITNRLAKVDAILLRLNLILLLFVSVLPFPTGLLAEGSGNVSDQRVFVTMYGLVLLAIRIMLYAVDEYAHKEQFYDAAASQEKDVVRRTILPVIAAYLVAIVVGFILPTVAVGLYCALTIYLVIPFKELGRVLFHRG